MTCHVELCVLLFLYVVNAIVRIVCALVRVAVWCAVCDGLVNSCVVCARAVLV